MDDTKYIEMTGKTTGAGFSTKAVLLSLLAPYGFEHGKMTKKNNKVKILATDNKNSETDKMLLAKELGVEILTYEEIAVMFDLTGDL